MHRRLQLVSLLVAGAVALLIAGCGDDGASSGSATTDASTGAAGGISSAEFTASADSRCAEANAALAGISSDAYAERAAIIRDLLNGLRSLGSPPDPSGALDRFYSALDEEATRLEQLDPSTELSAQPGVSHIKAQRAAREFGLDGCARRSAAGEVATAAPEATPTVTTPTTTPLPTTTTPVPTTPTVPAPPAPAPPAPAPAPPTGGTGAGGTGGSSGGGSSGGSSGGISPGG